MNTYGQLVDSLTGGSALGVTVVGSRGSGKSALCFKLLEDLHERGCDVAVFGFPESVELPRWIVRVANVDEVPGDCFLYVDEGAVMLNSRDSMRKANKRFSELLVTARHRGVPVIVSVQNSGMLELNVLRLTDVFVLKQPSLVQLDLERPFMRKIYAKSLPAFARLKKKGVSLQPYFFVRGGCFQGLGRVGLPSFWNDDVSKAFRVEGTGGSVDGVYAKLDDVLNEWLEKFGKELLGVRGK